MAQLLSWVQSTPLATTIGQSLALNAALSSLHLLGIALLVGGALATSLRLMGISLVAWPAEEVTNVIRRGIALGLGLTVLTGLLLVSPRAVNAAANSYFQTKMILFLAALVFHVVMVQRASVMTLQGRRAVGVGATSVLLWTATMICGLAFILLE